MQPIHGGFHSHGGTPIAGWFSSWKIHTQNAAKDLAAVAACPAATSPRADLLPRSRRDMAGVFFGGFLG